MVDIIKQPLREICTHIFEFNVDNNENVTVEVTDSMIINAPDYIRNQFNPEGFDPMRPELDAGPP